MADNTSSNWDEFWEGFRGMGDNMITGIGNLVSGHDWGYNNTDTTELLFGPDYGGDKHKEPTTSSSTSTPTLNEVAEKEAQDTGPFVQNPDLTVPQNNLGTNSAGGQDDINLNNLADFNSATQNTNTYSHKNLLENIDITEREKIEANEKLIDDENNGSRGERTWKTISNFWNAASDAATDSVTNSILDIDRTKNEKYAAVGYNEDTGSIIRLALNEGQGYFDDFHDTLFSVGEGSKAIFEKLYSEYAENNNLILNSGLDEYSMVILLQENRDAFKKEVEERDLIKLYDDDYYSNTGGWFYPNMVATNMLSGKGFWESFDTLDRRKDQFTQDELKTLAKTGIKSADDEFKLSDSMFDAFLQAYEANLKYNNDTSIGVGDTNQVRYAITEEDLAEMRDGEAQQIYSGVRDLLQGMVDNGTISSEESNKILKNSYAGNVDYMLDQMHLYMDPALAYYAAVKNKQGPLNENERAILGFGPAMFQLMDDMTNAISVYLQESIKQGIKEGKLSTSLEQINGMSINDFFKDAIKESNIKAGGIELSARDSAIDAMQWINQNVSYLYWKDKGSWLRQAKTEAGKYLGAYGWTGGELFQDITVGALRLFGADKLADYTLADATTLMNLTTDAEAFGNENWGRLLKKYGLSALENLPEFYGVYKSFSPLTSVGRAGGSIETLKKIEKMKDGVKKVKALDKYYKSIKQGVGGVSGAGGTKGFISKMTNALSSKFSPETRAVFKKGSDVINRVVADQAIDMIASYYDTENYSTPSYLLSVGLTGAFELFPALFLDTEALKILKNSLTPGRGALDGTGWRLMNIVTSNDELMKRWTNIYGLDYDTFRTLAKGGMNDSLDNILKASYEALDEGGKAAQRRFSKEVAINQINSIMNIDWQSSYGKTLSRIANNSQTNGLDIRKYVLGIPGKIEYGGFQSSILFKEGADTQTRYLLSAYDNKLDRIDGQFRRKLENGFTEDSIKQIANIKQGDSFIYKDVLDNGKINSKYFIKDGDKYILNSDGANYLGLKVSNYTDAMRRADVLKAQSKGVEDEINNMLANLSSGRGISPDTVKALAQSGAYTKMVDTFSVFC